MPRSKQQLVRYRIIDNELRNRSWIKSTHLKKIIEDKLNKSVDIRTIQKDILAMKDDADLAYYAPIEYDNKKKAFRYDDRNYSISNFALHTSEINALKFYASCLQIYSEYGLFKDFSSAIHKIITGISIKSFLKKETNPDLIIQTDTVINIAGTEFLELIVQAIDEKSNISFLYEKFTGEQNKQERTISPFLLKEYRNRWYVLGMSGKEKKIKTFGLERMYSVSLAGGNYEKDSAFDPEKYFKHSFGITTPDGDIQRIVLEFSKNQIPYIKSLPIHPTQQILSETAEVLTISIEIIPSYELYEYILGKMPDVKVISPAAISTQIKEMLEGGLQKNLQ